MHAKKNMEQTACTLLGGAPTCGGLNHEKSSPTIFFYLISTVFFFVQFSVRIKKEIIHVILKITSLSGVSGRTKLNVMYLIYLGGGEREV